MASIAHRRRGGERARYEKLEHMLTQEGAVLRNRMQNLRDGLPTETTGVTDAEEHSLDAEGLGIGFSVLEITSRNNGHGQQIGVTRVFGREFETTGLLGISAGANGQSSQVAFPSWICKEQARSRPRALRQTRAAATCGDSTSNSN